MLNFNESFETKVNIFIIFSFTLYVFYKIVEKYYKYRDIAKKLPTIYGLPLVGNVPRVLPLTEFLYKLGAYFCKLNSLTFLTWLGMEPLIVTIDPEIIQRVLNSEEFLNKCRILYQPMDNALPNGIITSRVFKWKHNRKLMNSSFSLPILQSFIPIFQRVTKKICQHFDTLLDNKEHPIFDYLKKTVMEIALETVMGLEIVKDPLLSEELVHNLHNLMEKICLDTALSPLNLGFLVRTATYYKIKRILRQFMKNFIIQKTKLKTYNKEGDYFLNRALKYEQQGLFDTEDTITETYTMISGAFETTSTTIYSLIVMLAMHSDVQEKLYQEIISVIPPTEDIQYEHLEHLPYLKMVISETLRLVPPISLIGREAMENCQLTKDLAVERDFQILISVFHLHRCKKLWGLNAHKFNPDNFLAENIEKRHPYAYVPFSKGVRNCIGWRYAEISLKFMLLDLVRQYKFSTTFPYENLCFVQKIGIQYLKEPKIRITKRM